MLRWLREVVRPSADVTRERREADRAAAQLDAARALRPIVDQTANTINGALERNGLGDMLTEAVMGRQARLRGQQ
ncbi:hypothetical protein [Nocardia phage NBR1]|uniref:hypothetical protein n=1 Tax=Nocardia phage NBR1 TaxID=1109711 RepID=UPI00023EEDE8|nr:hypothetical protein NoPhNBR1_gp37 [Nocardia phage NBR1]AEV52250.1 hypothetical protein [Nocardia phage NBR1]